MPESRSDQIRHSNEEVSNFLTYGDARGPVWLASHPADRDKAIITLETRVGNITTPPPANAGSERLTPDPVVKAANNITNVLQPAAVATGFQFRTA